MAGCLNDPKKHLPYQTSIMQLLKGAIKSKRNSISQGDATEKQAKCLFSFISFHF